MVLNPPPWVLAPIGPPPPSMRSWTPKDGLWPKPVTLAPVLGFFFQRIRRGSLLHLDCSPNPPPPCLLRVWTDSPEVHKDPSQRPKFSFRRLSRFFEQFRIFGPKLSTRSILGQGLSTQTEAGHFGHVTVSLLRNGRGVSFTPGGGSGHPSCPHVR